MNKVFFNLIMNFLSLFGVYAIFSISKIHDKVIIEIDNSKIVIILLLAVVVTFLQYKKSK